MLAIINKDAAKGVLCVSIGAVGAIYLGPVSGKG